MTHKKLKKCEDCRKPLKYFYFGIGASKLCKECASELINDISDFKISLSEEK